MHLEHCFLAAEPPRPTDLSPLAYDRLVLEVIKPDGRSISLEYGLHPASPSDCSLLQRLAGYVPEVVSRWTEVPWPLSPGPIRAGPWSWWWPTPRPAAS